MLVETERPQVVQLLARVSVVQAQLPAMKRRPALLRREQGTPALSTRTPPVFLGPKRLGKAQHLPTAAFAPVILVSRMEVLKISTSTRIELFINPGAEAWLVQVL